MKATVEKKEIRDPNEPAECKRRITVFHFIGSLHVGGAEEQLVSLVTQFGKEKFRIIVGTMQPGGGLMDRLAEAGIENVCLNFRVRSCVQFVFRMAALLKREKVDVLHMHMYYASRYGRLAGILAGVPAMVCTDHGHDPWKNWWHLAFDRYLAKRTSLRIGVAQDIADTIMRRENLPTEKIAVVPNGVDTERFKVSPEERAHVRTELGIADDELLVGGIGRLADMKAFHILIEAVSIARGKVPKIRLVLVGDGPLRGQLEQRAADLGIADRVTFTGIRYDIPAVLAAFDIFAMSSEREGMPISLLEAMSAGKPIVATRVGGIPEAVTDHVEGLLVNSGSPQAMADAIVEIASDPGLAAKLGQRASERAAADYSVAATARKLEQLYCTLLAKRH